MADLTGAAQRQCDWHELTEAEIAAAVAELHEILAGRDDVPALLAEVAGVLLGFSEGAIDEPKARVAAQLCRLAGADETLIPRWAKEGAGGQPTPPCRRSPADCAP